jgi:translation initiation factor IF-3
MSQNKTRTNEQITASQVRLIDADGNIIGIIPTKEALAEAYNLGLDLVEMSANTEIPVCKIIDFSKHCYRTKKKIQEAKKKQKQVSTKQIKLRPNIAAHDYGVKLTSAQKFLQLSNKIKVIMQFKGREVTHDDIVMNIVQKFKDELLTFGKVELEPQKEGKKTIVMVMVPK